MTFKALLPLKVKTQNGMQKVAPGQLVELPPEKALDAVTAGKLRPVGRVAYFIHSEILGGHLWLVATDEDREALLAPGDVVETIYTFPEVRDFKGCSPESLMKIQPKNQGGAHAT